MQRTRAILLVFWFVQISVGLHAAEPIKIKVGDPAVSGRFLKPYKNLWRLSVRSANGKENPDAATWSDELRLVTVRGREIFERIQVAKFQKDGHEVATTETRNTFEPRTMAPISRSFTKRMVSGGDESTTIEFHPLSVHLEQMKDGRATSRDVKIATPVYDFYGGLYGLLLVVFPLKQGYSAAFASLDEFTPTVSWTSFTVTGQENVQAGRSGTVMAWVVESNTNQGPMRFWLSKDAPYVIRLEFTDHDSGATWTYQMI